jgi:hypothetical protein
MTLFIATAAFLITELAGLINEVPYFTVIGRALLVYGVVLLFGSLMSQVLKAENQESPKEDVKIDVLVDKEEADIVAKDSVLRALKDKPKQAAKAIEAMIKK